MLPSMTPQSVLLPFQGGAGQTPNPWFTVANQFVPRNLHDVIRWARYITLQSPTTSEVIRKLATYPITDFNVDTTKDSLKVKYKEIFKSFRLKEGLQNIGFEYFTIGNCFVSIYFPIHRSLVCPTCGTSHNAKTAVGIEFKQYQFVGTCQHCSFKGTFQRVDTKSTSIQDMNLISWNPEHISVNHNPITGEYEYYYNIPNNVKAKIQKGDKLFVNSIPWGFVDAVRYNQSFKFDANNLFHLQNVTTGGRIDGIAVPPLISLFSLVFYQATLRKANEAIATEHITPLRVVFPQAQTGNSDPVISMSLRSFVSNMENTLMRHKQDPNHILVAPVPVGYQNIGGEGKNLLVSQEIQQAEEALLLSLGVSRELLSGTTNWTSSSVGLRMMENLLFSYTTRLQELIDWVMQKVTSYISIETAPVTLQPFKLIDDDTFKQVLMSLSQSDVVSKTTLFNEFGLDFNRELDLRKEEQVAVAKFNVETQTEVDQANVIAARNAGDSLRDNEEYNTLMRKAQIIALQLAQTDEVTRQEMLNELRVSDYTYYILVSTILKGQQQAPGQPEEQGQPGQPGQPGQGQEGQDEQAAEQGQQEQPEGREQGQDQKSSEKKPAKPTKQNKNK